MKWLIKNTFDEEKLFSWLLEATGISDKFHGVCTHGLTPSDGGEFLNWGLARVLE